MPGKERAKYLFRIARIIQERGRELAVLESIDNGKPIKETRDVDVPIAAAHFFYYAGWADKLEYSGHGTESPRRRGPGDPVELPAADAVVEDRARPGLRQHRRAEAGRDDAADRPALRRDLPAGRPARRASSTSSPAPATPVARWSRTRTSTRSRSPARPTSARRSRSAVAGTEQAGHPGARRQGRQHRLRRRTARPGGRGHRQRHLLQPGPRLLRGLSAARAGERRRRRARAAQAPRRHAAGRRPARQEHRHRRDQLRGAAGQDPRAVRHRRAARAPTAGRRRASCPTTASGSRRRSSPVSPRPTGSPARRSSGRCCRC